MLKHRLKELFASYKARLAVTIISIRVNGPWAFDWGWHQLTLTPKKGGSPIITERKRIAKAAVAKREEGVFQRYSQTEMNFLTVTNGLKLPVSGLAKKTPLNALTGPTVASAARDTLRRVYRKSEIKVSQSASLGQDGWQGQCRIQGVEYSYRVSSQPANEHPRI